MYENRMGIPVGKDNYFALKDIMRFWGDKHSLTTDEVLKAVSESMFHLVRGENRVRFLVYQDDVDGVDIFLSVPANGAR